MELEIVKFVQNWANGFLDVFFWLITKMGEETFFLVILSIIYISYDKFFAVKFSYYYLISVGVNNLIKIIAMRPRPHIASNEVLNRLPASGYSFPSGHTQGFFVISATSMVEINIKNKNKKFKLTILISLCVLGVLVMLSRLYWGQHYLSDVVVGMMFGISIPFVLDWIIGILPKNFKSIFTKDRMFLFLGILSLILFLVLLPLELVLGFWSSKVYKFIAVFLAMSIGYFVDKKFIKYEPGQGLKKGILKSLLTVLVLVGLYLIIDLIIPIRGFVYFIVYLFLGLICTIIFPLIYKFLFKKVNDEECNCK